MERTGDTLKIRYINEKQGIAYVFSPVNLYVELNGERIILCQHIHLDINAVEGLPRATITFMVDHLDIDTDSIIALEAIVKSQKEKADGEGT